MKAGKWTCRNISGRRENNNGLQKDFDTIPEPDKTIFFNPLRDTVLRFGDRVEFRDTYILYLAKKPQGRDI